jgi:hypothetical protein
MEIHCSRRKIQPAELPKMKKRMKKITSIIKDLNIKLKKKKEKCKALNIKL